MSTTRWNLLTVTAFVIYIVTRERLYFVGLRQAFFLSSFQAQRLSSRTVLFLGIPEDQLKEAQLRALLGPYVRKIWMAPDCEKLQDLIDDKDKLWTKFEKAQVSMTLNANKKRMKANDTSENEPYKFVDQKKRPTHKLKFLIGKKVDTIDYGRTELPKMSQQIESQQNSALDGKSKGVSAAFVEFSSQAAAQEAFQVAAREKKTTWSPRYIGVQPEEVIWKNLGVSYKSRKTKMLIATTFIVLLTLFWAIPVAFVGILSNINYLTNKVPFLSFINSIPPVILGVVTGLLPSILLTVLMALVPIICRCELFLSPMGDTLQPRSLTICSDCQIRRRSDFVDCGAQNAELVFHLPGHPGVSHHHIHIWSGIGCQPDCTKPDYGCQSPRQ